jgi:peptide/nickel transport system substrate-binding protein
MWARIGLRVRAETMPKTQYFQKVLKLDASAFLLGWGGTPDPIFLLKAAFRSRNASGDGGWNVGDLRHDRLDRVIDAMESEMDGDKRMSLIIEAIVRDEVLALPLHRQAVAWVSRPNVSVVMRPSNSIVPMWVKVR